MLRIKSEKGQALVETALVLPLLLMILFGIFDFGWVFFTRMKIENTAREGARFAAVNFAQEAANEAASIDAIKQHVVNERPELNLTTSDVVVTLSGTGEHYKRYITVQINTELTPLTHFFDFLWPSIDFSTQVTMYREKEPTT